MARPTTRAELLAAAAARYTALTSLIDEMSDAERVGELRYPPTPARPEAHWARDRNLRDVLVHLTEWHTLLLNWVGANAAGEPRPFLPEPYTWRNYAPMNLAFRDAHADTTLAAAREQLTNSHAATMALISGYSDTELFENRHFAWTGTTSLGAYCVSATSSHCEWAVKKLRAARG